MQKPIELVVKGKTLRGMYHYPDGDGIYPTVILFHGFTGNKLEPHRIFLKLSRRLTASGLAVIRFDFSGSGESDGDFEEMTFSSEVFEAQEILKFVSYLPTTDAERIGLVGLSMGGAVASIIAGNNPSTVKALVLWAAADIDTIMGIYRQQEKKGYFLRNEHGQIDIGGLWLNENFYADLGKWNTYETLQAYQGPALILHGTGDEVVPPTTAEQYQAALGGRARLIYIPEADHTFNRHAWEEQVLTETTKFLTNTLF
ncbi:MAG TPA: alpha/beta fold hydrolase [Firmicutes bacterium]|uniref:Alpha/beta fold hydrolase n=1 Tax=Capillibacterium thermochitinicola TaxID=2699427 RepID=A0A8J6HZ62_9FIRM|nr:alpha/beta fold hydrolase [Capillibacterium thermochitinicola]MBA2132745.1 alpha/beta fold hydrolase [Capillibacterium thermochitinicola]HHW12492.1 alpha/beta fold hydrolase [Bacillota bacterium]